MCGVCRALEEGGAFWIAPVPFAFKFEYDRPNDNLATVCHRITIH